MSRRKLSITVDEAIFVESVALADREAMPLARLVDAALYDLLRALGVPRERLPGALAVSEARRAHEAQGEPALAKTRPRRRAA